MLTATRIKPAGGQAKLECHSARFARDQKGFGICISLTVISLTVVAAIQRLQGCEHPPQLTRCKHVVRVEIRLDAEKVLIECLENQNTVWLKRVNKVSANSAIQIVKANNRVH